MCGVHCSLQSLQKILVYTCMCFDESYTLRELNYVGMEILTCQSFNESLITCYFMCLFLNRVDSLHSVLYNFNLDSIFLRLLENRSCVNL